MHEPTSHNQSLRLKPGVVILILQYLLRFGLPLLAFQLTPLATFAGLLGWIAILIWWSFFSRASGYDRLFGASWMVVAVAATPLILHESIAAAFNGVIFVFYFTPVLSLTFVAWAVVTRRLDQRSRRIALIVTVLLTSGGWALLRFEGMVYAGGAEFAWRWTKTAEERFLSQRDEAPDAPASTPSSQPEEPAWPAFRGPDRNSHVTGIRLETNWADTPPAELWRRPVGPGWSSFAVSGDLFYTQEQHGESEVVATYRLSTGAPVWRHEDKTRFWEAIGGPGPRATPTIHAGRVYTFGATGILNALDAQTGSVIWSTNVAADTHVGIPEWGFSSSPLIVGDMVIVAAAATPVAYELETGDLRWFGKEQGGGYSSPHLFRIEGTSQVLLLTAAGLTSFAPGDGARLWAHDWPGDGIVQPALTPEGDILLGTGAQSSRISISKQGTTWAVNETWSSNGLKPYFNDFVIHEGHAYGVDGRHLACIDIATGERKWKGGRYGGGQLLLLPDADQLLVVSEQGKLALVAASPNRFTQLAEHPAVDGKTWNHPVLVDNILLVRNGEEMAAFKLNGLPE